MKLQPECIRDILLEIEKQPKNEPFLFNTLATNLSKYSQDELEYTCMRMEEGGLISLATYDGNNHTFIAFINHITYSGHQFLATIESDKIWDKTKIVLAKLGVSSLTAIGQISTQILTEYIQTLF